MSFRRGLQLFALVLALASCAASANDCFRLLLDGRDSAAGVGLALSGTSRHQLEELISIDSARSKAFWKFVFSHDGNTVALTTSSVGELSRNDVTVLDLGGTRPVRVLPGAENTIRDLQFSPDDHRLVGTSTDLKAHFWDLDSGVAEARSFNLDLLGRGMHAILSKVPFYVNFPVKVALAPNGSRMAIGEFNDQIQVVSLPQRKVLKRIKDGMKGDTLSPALLFNRDGTLLAAGAQDGHVVVHRLETGDQVHIRGTGSEWLSFSFSEQDENSLDVLSRGLVLTTYDLRNGERIRSVDIAPFLPKRLLMFVQAVAFSQKSQTLALGLSNGGFMVIDLEKAAPVYHQDFGTRVSGIAFSDDGLRLAASFEANEATQWRGRFKVWKVSEREL